MQARVVDMIAKPKNTNTKIEDKILACSACTTFILASIKPIAENINNVATCKNNDNTFINSYFAIIRFCDLNINLYW